ncbi:MAG: hypothetical protein KDE33_25460, partial [Bacteroidetes bacterium]|nr:hypothetical protein [Bacteroidota bacterium]
AYKVRSNYPKKYWRCDDDRDNPSANMKFALDELFKEIKGSGKTMLRDAGTELFFMNTLADVNTFYVQNEPIVPLGGFTFTSPLAPNTQTYVNVFTLVNGEDLLAFQEKLLSATGHEFGHAVDFTRGSESEMNPTYTTWVNSDIQFLNFNSDGTRRDPCVGSILHKAPFENVLDERSGNPLCVNGQLIAAYNQLPTNFDVLKSATRLGVFGGPPYDEPYAQVFGWASADAFQNQNDTLGYTITGVLNNDFFGCAAAWADAARNGQATPPSPPLGVTYQ